jgi:hypothetical protein
MAFLIEKSIRYYDFYWFGNNYRLEVTNDFIGTFFLYNDYLIDKDNYIEQRNFKTQENLDLFLQQFEMLGTMLNSFD